MPAHKVMTCNGILFVCTWDIFGAALFRIPDSHRSNWIYKNGSYVTEQTSGTSDKNEIY